MKLAYRGLAYSAEAPAICVVETGRIGHFLGHTFPIQQSTVTRQSSPSVDLTYRGLHYSR